MEDNPWIYESPDGDTIYRRRFGSSDRQLYREGILRKKYTRQQKWQDILNAAESDTALKELLDRVEIYWNLKCGQ